MPVHLLKILHRILGMATRNCLGTITHVATQDSVAALTFDDGPHPEFTRRLLDILDKYQARATFFMIGKAAQCHPELVKQIAYAGHAIGNHSFDHPSFPYISGRQRRAQIRICAKTIYPYGLKLFRPPYGHQSLASRLDALWLGYEVITWSIIAQDWLERDAQWMANRIMGKIQPGSVILFHDALYDAIDKRYADRGSTLQAVDLLLKQLQGCYRFITIPELLKLGRPQRQHWFQKADINFLNRLKVMEEEAGGVLVTAGATG